MMTLRKAIAGRASARGLAPRVAAWVLVLAVVALAPAGEIGAFDPPAEASRDAAGVRARADDLWIPDTRTEMPAPGFRLDVDENDPIRPCSTGDVRDGRGRRHYGPEGYACRPRGDAPTWVDARGPPSA